MMQQPHRLWPHDNTRIFLDTVDRMAWYARDYDSTYAAQSGKQMRHKASLIESLYRQLYFSFQTK